MRLILTDAKHLLLCPVGRVSPNHQVINDLNTSLRKSCVCYYQGALTRSLNAHSSNKSRFTIGPVPLYASLVLLVSEGAPFLFQPIDVFLFFMPAGLNHTASQFSTSVCTECSDRTSDRTCFCTASLPGSFVMYRSKQSSYQSEVVFFLI